MVRYGNSFMQIVVEERASAFKREDALRLQQHKKFFMDHLEPFHDGLLGVVCPLHRFLNVVDGIQEGEQDPAFSFLSKFVAVTLDPATVVLEIRQRAQMPITLRIQILPQSLDFPGQVGGGEQAVFGPVYG